jgi:hypothetical protein
MKGRTVATLNKRSALVCAALAACNALVAAVAQAPGFDFLALLFSLGIVPVDQVDGD